MEVERLEVDFCSASSASASSQTVGNTFQEFKVAKIVFRAEQFQLGALPLHCLALLYLDSELERSYLCIVDRGKWLLLLPVKAWEILQSRSNTQIHNFRNTQIQIMIPKSSLLHIEAGKHIISVLFASTFGSSPYQALTIININNRKIMTINW